METQFSPNTNIDFPEVIETENEIQRLKTKSTSYTSPKDVSDIIRSPPNRKAPGINKIANTAIKHFPKMAMIRLSYI